MLELQKGLGDLQCTSPFTRMQQIIHFERRFIGARASIIFRRRSRHGHISPRILNYTAVWIFLFFIWPEILLLGWNGVDIKSSSLTRRSSADGLVLGVR